AGSPRVALWPNAVACCVLAALVWLLARWAKSPIVSTPLWIVSMLGFALVDPLAAVPLVLALGLGRWLGNIETPRRRLRLVVELSVWTALIAVVLGTLLVTLQSALFSASPVDVTSFVSAPYLPSGEGWDSSAAVQWGTYVAGDPDAARALPSPWAWTVPLLLLRLIWAAWAVAIAVFLAREGRLALTQLSRYWQAARARAATTPSLAAR
ncbi:MAG: hypothetical protein AAB426_03790, partial [Myxococcota bacterium]